MLAKPFAEKRYSSAKQRFLKPAIVECLAREIPLRFGPDLRDRMADKLLEVFFSLNQELNTIQPGQMLWHALHKDTRADSPKRKLVPVILTIVDPHDVDQLSKGTKNAVITRNSIARIIKEAFQQGGILSMRDVGLLTLRSGQYVSKRRIEFEELNKVTLPHTGNLHDMGTCISHKKQIVTKVILEKKDPVVVARETKHSQRAVDNYLKDYHRVRTVYKDHPQIDYIHIVTGIARHVVKQYIEIIKAYEKHISS